MSLDISKANLFLSFFLLSQTQPNIHWISKQKLVGLFSAIDGERNLRASGGAAGSGAESRLFLHGPLSKRLKMALGHLGQIDGI